VKRIDFSEFIQSPNGEELRQMNPQRETWPQAAKERNPDYHQRRSEREGRSEWSGGWAGGGTWAGRSR